MRTEASPGGLRGTRSAGGRRAGLTAHWFSRNVIGQEKRVHTGWLEAEPSERRVVYAPHTKTGYRFPASLLVYRLVAGFGTRRGLRGARRAGFLTVHGSTRGAGLNFTGVPHGGEVVLIDGRGGQPELGTRD